MKKYVLLLLCLLCAASSSAAAEEVIEIKERVFVALINEIYLNAEDYAGKKIRLQGVFEVFRDEDTGEKFYSVTRRGPGCCGSDLNPGFEVVWDKKYPEPDVWVDVTGIMEIYDEGYVRLRVTDMSELPESEDRKLYVQ